MANKNRDLITGTRLKALRESKGIRQNFIAEKMGISNNYLSELEAGKRRWYVELVYKYENLLGI